MQSPGMQSPGRQTLNRFAVDLYQTPGIAPLCLDLQDQHGCDIPLLLFLCWHGCYLGRISAPALEQALCLSRQWAQQLVHPLRASRRWLKADSNGCTNHIELSIYHTDSALRETLREQIKALELQAELLQLEALERLARQAAAGKKGGTLVASGSTAGTESLSVADCRHAIDENLRSGLHLMTLKPDTQNPQTDQPSLLAPLLIPLLIPLREASLLTAGYH